VKQNSHHFGNLKLFRGICPRSFFYRVSECCIRK